jgi:DNA excision repair protein ERCC-4
VFVQPSDKEYQSTTEMALNRTLVGDLPNNIKLVLEEQPKWKLLQDILDEIEEDVTTNTIHGKEDLVFAVK